MESVLLWAMQEDRHVSCNSKIFAQKIIVSDWNRHEPITYWSSSYDSLSQNFSEDQKYISHVGSLADIYQIKAFI